MVSSTQVISKFAPVSREVIFGVFASVEVELLGQVMVTLVSCHICCKGLRMVDAMLFRYWMWRRKVCRVEF
jgi:hypothetical protein